MKTVTGKICIAIVGFCWLASWARGDDSARIRSLIDQMRTGKTESSAVKTEEDNLVSQNESSLKEFNAYKSGFEQLEQEKKAKIENSPVLRNAERRLKATDDMVEEWNKTYSKERVGLLPEATYKEGVRRRAQVETTVNAIRADVKHSVDNFKRTEIAPIEATQARQKKAMDDVAARIKANFAQWQKLKEKGDALEAKLQSLRNALVSECKTATTIEGIKYCSSIGWDNMRKDLPPLTDIRPPFGASANP